MSARLRCPACGEEGDRTDADQAACTAPACRVTTLQTTTPPDALGPDRSRRVGR